MTLRVTHRLKLLPFGVAMLLLAGCPDPDGPIGPGKDTEQPSLQIASPTAGATLLTDSVTIEGTATDNVEVTRLTYALNGGSEQEVSITAGKSVSFRFALPVQNGAGSLTLTAHDAASNRGSRSVAFTVDACIPTLAAAAAAPTSELTVQSVPARLAQLRGLVRVPGTDQAASVFPERKENGEVSLVVPLHPAGAAGGDAELILSDGTSACRPVPFRIAPLAPASGTSEQVISGVQQVAGTIADAIGVDRARLLSDPAELAPELRPLAMALQLLEGPNNPNSLKALLDGSAPALEGTTLDRELASSLLAESGIPQALQHFQQRLAALGPPPGRSAPAAPLALTLAEAAALQPTSTAITPEELDYWMKVQAEAMAWQLPNQGTQLVYRALLGYILHLAAAQSSPLMQELLLRMALQLIAIIVQDEALQIMKTGLSTLLPSQLDPLALRVDPTILGIGATGAWSAELRARGEAWSLLMPSYVAGQLQNAGSLGILLNQLLMSNAATPAQEAAITKLVGILQGTLQASLGSMQCTQLTCAVAAAPIVYGPVDVTGESYSSVTFTPQDFVRLANGNRRALTGLAATPEGDPARMRVTTLASWFAGRTSAGEQAITVTARALLLSILQVGGVAVDPAATPVVGGQGTFRLRIQAGEGEVCAVRFGADAAQAPTTPDAEPVLRFNPCLQPGTATEADLNVSFATRADGIYHAGFEVTDGKGVQRWSPAVLVEVRKQTSDDQTPPTFSNLKRISNGQEVADGSTVTTAQVTLQGTVTDEGGVQALTYSLNGGTPAAVPNVTLGTSVAFNFSITLASGQNVITLTARDNAGNEGAATIRLTFTAPAVSCDLTSPYTRRWTGGNSTSWSDAGNWSPAGVPGQSDRLMICANAPNQPTLAASTTISAILVQPGATLTVANQVVLNVAGNIDAEGPISGPGLTRLTADGVVRGTVGNLTISGGVLNLGSHHLMVTGNLEVNNHGLRMTDEAALLQVLGDLTMNASPADTTKLTAGTIELGGNLRVHSAGYTPAGTHTMVFNGTQAQTVNFANGSQANWARFQNVTIQNPAGITLLHGAYVHGLLRMQGQGKLIASDNAPVDYGTRLPQTSAGYQVAVSRIKGKIVHDGSDGSLDLPNGGKLWMDQQGTLELRGGTFTVTGDMEVSSHSLIMNTQGVTLRVLGNLTMNASPADTTKLTAGTIELGGNLRVHSAGYTPAGTHTMILGGTEAQSVHFVNGSQASWTRFQNVSIHNPAGVTLVHGIYVHGLLRMQGEGKLIAAAEQPVEYGNRLPQTSAGYQVAVSRIAGTVVHEESFDLPNAGKLVIPGSTQGTLELRGGTFTLTGNLEVNNHGLKMTTEGVVLRVLGNLTMNAAVRDNTNLTAGTIELSGNLLVHSAGYMPTGTHTTILNGSAAQTVNFHNGSQADWTRFQNVSIENPAGVTFVHGVHVLGVLEVGVGSKLVLASETTHVQQTFYLRDHAALQIDGTLTCGNPMSRAKNAVISGTGSNYCYNRLLNQKAVIVRLTWQGESPYDQDAYLSGPRTNGGRFEVNKDNPSYTSATTVHAQYLFDDRIGFGPTHPDTEGLEIVRIFPAAFPDAALQGADGAFRFSVHDFTNATRAGSTMLSQSNARVEVLHGFGETGTLLTAFDVPVGKAGNWWHVFEMRIDNIDPQNPKFSFTALNQVVDTGTPDDPQPPAPTQGKKWNDPSNFSYSQPDYGLYWFRGAQDGRKSLGRNQDDAYYNPNRPTMIYVHGAQNDSWKTPRETPDLRRETFLFADRDQNFYGDIITEWVNAGWNVGIFYWDKFADEESLPPYDGEAKIWTSAGPKGMRWRKPDGSFADPFQFSPRKSAMDLFYEAYIEALHYQDANREIRVVGHSLGNQMAVRMSMWVSDQVRAGAIGANLLPRRIALLDPFWSQGGKDYLSGAWTGEMVRQFVQTLKDRHGIVFEQYQTSAINDRWMGDKNHELQAKTAFVRIHPDYVSFDQIAQAHGEAIYWYFSSFKTGAFLCTENPVTFTQTPVPSAAMPTETLRSWMNSGSYDWLEQVWGKDARSTSNDCFARRKE